EADTDPVRLVDAPARLPFLRQRGGNGVEPDRTAIEFEDHRLEQLAVHRLQTQLVEFEHRERLLGGVCRRPAVGPNLRVIPYSPQQSVSDSRGATRPARDLRDG